MASGGLDDSSSFGEKFSDLLKPIRDLAQNWDINIANELEDYLEDLEEIKISFDGTSESLNFAEAAMLIQGSTCVYSRKVEFLYSLVFQTLDLIADRKKARDPNVSVGLDADIDQRLLEDEEFILLDDLPEAKNITLHEAPTDTQSLMEASRANLLPPTPLALTMNDGEFSMMHCSVNASGTLLLNDAADLLAHGAAGDALAGAMPSPIVGLRPGGAFADLDDDGDDSDDFGADDVGADLFGANDGERRESDAGAVNPLSDSMMNFEEALRFQQTQAGGVRQSIERAMAEEEADPWAALDPHQEHPELVRPYRRGKTARTPKEEPRTELEAPASALAFLTALSKPSSAAISGTYFSTQFGAFEALEAKRRKQKSLLEAKAKAAMIAPAELLASQEEEEEEQLQASGGVGFDAGDFDAGLLSDGDDEYDDVEPINMDVYDDHGTGADGGDRRLSNVVKSFEDLCREHMDAHALEAEKLSNDAGMTRRVAEWQSSLEPILEEEEARKPFDIHECGDDMLTRLSKLAVDSETGQATRSLEFQDVMCQEGDTRIAVCRNFLACLVLANDGNVHIQRPDADTAAPAPAPAAMAKDGGAAAAAGGARIEDGTPKIGMMLKLLDTKRTQIEHIDLAATAAIYHAPPPSRNPKPAAAKKGAKKGKAKGGKGSKGTSKAAAAAAAASKRKASDGDAAASASSSSSGGGALKTSGSAANVQAKQADEAAAPAKPKKKSSAAAKAKPAPATGTRRSTRSRS